MHAHLVRGSQQKK